MSDLHLTQIIALSYKSANNATKNWKTIDYISIIGMYVDCINF